MTPRNREDYWFEEARRSMSRDGVRRAARWFEGVLEELRRSTRCRYQTEGVTWGVWKELVASYNGT